MTVGSLSNDNDNDNNNDDGNDDHDNGNKNVIKAIGVLPQGSLSTRRSFARLKNLTGHFVARNRSIFSPCSHGTLNRYASKFSYG